MLALRPKHHVVHEHARYKQRQSKKDDDGQDDRPDGSEHGDESRPDAS
jgi:hypothetical protein